MKPLHGFFNPRSVAIIGASRNPKKVGHVIFRNFLEGGFKGRVFPVNPNCDDIYGHKTYPSVLYIKNRVDLAVICIPAAIVPATLRQCAKKRIHNVIIISGGFAEVGNHELEKQVKDIIEKNRMNVIGPNCVGIYDPNSNVDTFFLPRYKLERPESGDIAFISQSGALGSVMLDWMAMKGYRISRFVSYGNAVDVDESDLIEYLSMDRKTKVICAYFEGVEDGRRLFNTARKCSEKKPIIVLKGGSSPEGTDAVSSHTGSLAGSSRIYSAAFRQSNMVEADSIEELFDFARVFSTQPKPSGNRVQIITDGGGFGVLAADALSRNNLKPATLSKETLRKMEDEMPRHVVLKNPIDLTGDATTERYKTAIEATLADPNVDMIMVIGLLQMPTLTADIVDVVAELASKNRKPLVFVAAGGRFTEVLKKTLEDFGTPTFSYPEKAAKSLKALHEYYNTN
jgi:acetyl coenzyme A synthetase (ADP forming)-like protein